MKRINEKVKDIVEVRLSERLRDFIAEPPRTLANYHFTDSTSELMGKWLDRISSLREQSGAAFALAGYRGVGKSHFIATLGALVSNPELRSRVSDSHVASSAQRLMRRHYPVAYIRRGAGDTLTDEFKEAIAITFNLDRFKLPNDTTELLRTACELSGELPFILIVDTAVERSSRVSRDDGPILAEIALAVKDMNAFVGVALDDDISGADGSNSAISRTFSIDYLDQEHLYKVVNTHVFPKHSSMLPLLQEIYAYFREVAPGFRWSEQRFASLYPLHPAILEVAPFVRLFVHDFALLGFASEAGERILGRPANSLIALDEVFDNTETALRKIEDLTEAFEAYDRLNSEVVAQIPVMQRLQAKLILKALLLLSLDGQGTTATEISASMLIFDENDPGAAVENVENLTRTFAQALPDSIRVDMEEGRDTRYGFKLQKKDNLNKALSDAASGVSQDVVSQMMRRLMVERFSDCMISSPSDDVRKDAMDCQIEWRGGLRRGRLVWNSDGGPIPPDPNPSGVDVKDWEVIIDLASSAEPAPSGSETSRVLWRPDALRPNEVETILRYHILGSDAELREAYSDQVRAAVHSHAVSVEQIFNRVMLEDGRLVIDGFDYNFNDDSRTVSQLSDLFSTMLEPLFETRFPDHPYFEQKLGMVEVTTLVSDFYSGSRQVLNEVQHLAKVFAAPLGLVRLDNGLYVPESGEALKELPLTAKVMELVNTSTEPMVSLRTVYSELRREPLGLVREAQHLVLASLVAQRHIEFVTSKGDRINSRSLDLKIIWADIVGVAKPVESAYSIEKLDRWAMIFAGEADFSSLAETAGRENVKIALEKWLEDWANSAVLDRFSALPDELLNTRVWQVASRVGKKYGSVAENIKAARDNAIQVEDCLDRISDIFGDSPEEMDAARRDVAFLENFINGVATRGMINSYLTVCELTDDADLEQLRDKLFRIIDVSYSDPSDANNREMGYLWNKFQKQFASYYITRHDRVMHSHDIPEKFNEIFRTDKWWEYQNLSRMPFFDPGKKLAIDNVLRDFMQIECKYDVTSMLQAKPFCLCSFSLSRMDAWEDLPMRLWQQVGEALAAYRSQLSADAVHIADTIDRNATENSSVEFEEAAHKLSASMRNGSLPILFSNEDLNVLRRALESASSTPFAHDMAERSIHETQHDVDTRNWAHETSDDLMLLNL